jgi:hypothetical protein
MATMFFDLIIVLLWPLVLSAAAWLISINALADADEISEVVEALTQANSADGNANRGISPRRSNSRAISSGDGARFQVRFGRTRRMAVNILRVERPSDENNPFAQQ